MKYTRSDCTWRVDGDGERCAGGRTDGVDRLAPVLTRVTRQSSTNQDAAAAPTHIHRT